MSFNITIPRANDTLDLTVSIGERLFVLGANGAGKSSLMHRFYKHHSANARRISAHRQTWLTSNAITLSPEQKRTTAINIQGNDGAPEARWKDIYSEQRASISIYDLIDAENVRARSITAAVDADDFDSVRNLAKNRSSPQGNQRAASPFQHTNRDFH